MAKKDWDKNHPKLGEQDKKGDARADKMKKVVKEEKNVGNGGKDKGKKK